VALALLTVVGAAVLALLAGGRLTHLSQLSVRAGRLVAVTVLAQLLGDGLAVLTWHGFYPLGLAVSAVAALGFCLRNLRVAGVPLITLGLLANALVVIVNGAMPVSTHAAARAGVPVTAIAAGDDARHTIAGSSTTLRPLGDVIAVALPLRPEVDSTGDVLVAAGLGELVLLGMRPQRRLWLPRRSPTAVALQ
jgi:hypothetical protein